jgi:NADH-quinone oxidoreductase subunit L
MFEVSPTALGVVTFVGAATALFAATVGTVQNDIKRVIAYSTCSQLGYMFFAAGVGAYSAAMFHLFTHAFFKALLFLGAGSVIHAMHHEQDMRFYGGLRKSIPLTFWAMVAGTLAITGVGVLGVFGFAGFYSKDAIIESAYMSGAEASGFAFAVGIFAALLTSFYSWRLIFLTFFGKPRWAASEHIQHAVHDAHGHGHDHNDPIQEHSGDHPHPELPGAQHLAEGTGGYHPHESPWTMLVPLGLLAIGAIFAGMAFHHPFIEAADGARFWAGSLAFDEHLMEEIHHSPLWVKLAPAAVMAIGFSIAWVSYTDAGRAPEPFWPRRNSRHFIYWMLLLFLAIPIFIFVRLLMVLSSRRSTSLPSRFVEQFRVLHAFLLNKWYFDELYHYALVLPSLWIGRLFWKGGDEKVIDRFGPNGAAAVIAGGNKLTARLQSGYVYTYALVMLLGLAAAATWAMAR